MFSFHKNLVLAAAVGAGFAGPAMSQTASSGPTVTDANGKVVGTLVSPGYVLIKFSDGDALLGISPKGLRTPLPIVNQGAVDTNRYFTTTNCTGAAHVRVTQTPTFGYFDPAPPAATAAFSSGGVIYYPKRPYQTITALSYKASGDFTDGTCWPTLPDDRTFLAGALVNAGYYPRLTLPILVR